MDWTLLIPVVEKLGSWLGPVAATIIGGYGATKFTERSLDKRLLREQKAARLSTLEAKAEEVVAGAIRAIAGRTVVELNFIDPVVRLYFDEGVIAAYESLRSAVEDQAEDVISEKSMKARATVQKNQLTKELKRFLHNPAMK